MDGWTADNTKNGLCLASLGKSRLGAASVQGAARERPGRPRHPLVEERQDRSSAFGASPDVHATTLGQQGIVEWKTKKPFSANIDDWGTGKFVTPVDTPGKA